jgi:uncharacterized protein YqjF (DUF2071 family)
VAQHDFNRDILAETDHRPWPMPDRAWVMTQTWNDLLFAHWPVDKVLLAQKVPAPLELELYRGEAWIGIVPFHMTNVAPRGVPSLPVMSAFPELNVRTYVRYRGKPGVFFFSLDAGNSLAVTAARTLFNLPYYTATMTVENHDGRIAYSSRRTGSIAAAFTAEYGPSGPVFAARPGSLEYFLTERYCLFTVSGGCADRVDIHHPPWPLQEAEARIDTNTMTDPLGIRLPGRTPLLHFAKRQDMVAWVPTRD